MSCFSGGIFNRNGNGNRLYIAVYRLPEGQQRIALAGTKLAEALPVLLVSSVECARCGPLILVLWLQHVDTC